MSDLELKLKIDAIKVTEDLQKINVILSAMASKMNLNIPPISGMNVVLDSTGKVVKNLDDAKKKSDEFGQSIGVLETRGSVFGKISAETLGINQGLELIKKAISFLSKPLDIAGNFEQFEVQLKVMLGSTDKAKIRLAELTEFAKKTPFELPEVVQAANKLQAFGKYSQSLLTSLGDLSSATGKNIDQIINAYGKLASGQKGEAQMMFRDLLITTEDWVKATGKGVLANGELSASYKEMLDAVPRIIQQKGFSGMMAEQSSTLKGGLSNMKDSITNALRDIGDVFMPLIKDIAGVISTLASSFKNIGSSGFFLISTIGSLIPLFVMFNGSMGSLPYALTLIAGGLTSLYSITATGDIYLGAFAGSLIGIGILLFATSNALEILKNKIAEIKFEVILNGWGALAVAIGLVVGGLTSYAIANANAAKFELEKAEAQVTAVATQKKFNEEQQNTINLENTKIAQAKEQLKAIEATKQGSKERTKAEAEYQKTIEGLILTHPELISGTNNYTAQMALLESVTNKNTIAVENLVKANRELLILENQVAGNKFWADYNKMVEDSRPGFFANISLDFQNQFHKAAYTGSIDERIEALKKLQDYVAYEGENEETIKTYLNKIPALLLRLQQEKTRMLQAALPEDKKKDLNLNLNLNTGSTKSETEQLKEKYEAASMLNKFNEKTNEDNIVATEIALRKMSVEKLSAEDQIKYIELMKTLISDKLGLREIEEETKRELELNDVKNKSSIDFINGQIKKVSLIKNEKLNKEQLLEVEKTLKHLSDSKREGIISDASRSIQDFESAQRGYIGTIANSEDRKIILGEVLKKVEDRIKKANTDEERKNLRALKINIESAQNEELGMLVKLENQKKQLEVLRDQAKTLIDISSIEKKIGEKEEEIRIAREKTALGSKVIPKNLIDDYEKHFDIENNPASKDKIELDAWRNKELEKVRYYKDSEKAIELIDQTYKKKQEQIELSTQQKKLKIISNALGQVGQLFSKHTVMYKAFAIAQATIDTWAAATAALRDLPFPENYIVMAGTIASGLANVANIVDTKIPGYAHGGIVVGEKGPEIISPMQDYMSGQVLLATRTAQAVANAISSTPQNEKNTASPAVEYSFKIHGYDLLTANRRQEKRVKNLAWGV